MIVKVSMPLFNLRTRPGCIVMYEFVPVGSRSALLTSKWSRHAGPERPGLLRTCGVWPMATLVSFMAHPEAANAKEAATAHPVVMFALLLVLAAAG